jgi:hypothetical protein
MAKGKATKEKVDAIMKDAAVAEIPAVAPAAPAASMSAEDAEKLKEKVQSNRANLKIVDGTDVVLKTNEKSNEVPNGGSVVKLDLRIK